MANFNLNKVILGGRLTADPELKQTPQGVSVTSFSITVNRRGKEQQADFINCVAWNKTGEFVSKYFKKGQQVAVVGRLQTRTYDDANGQKRYVTEVVVEETYFADSKRDGAAGDFDSSFGGDPTMPTGNDSEFEVSSGDDLPF